MAFGKLVALLTLTVVSAQYNPSSYQNIPSKVLQVPEYVQESGRAPPPGLALTLQIPKEEPPLPFNSYAPLETEDGERDDGGDFFEVPVPSQDLQVPAVNEWNPENDPALYYELPVEITKEVAPTNLHPKKYDRGVFEKVKPISSKPKEEVLLVPVKVQDLIQRQKQHDKAALNFAKAENKRQLEAEKVKDEEQTSAETGFHEFGVEHPAPVSAGPGQRVEFHMQGHAGPKSYKWGYDTGKGHNRQFRYEERDKNGYVKGHYGYFDKHGKMQMVHYDAHPHEGFHADTSGQNF